MKVGLWIFGHVPAPWIRYIVSLRTRHPVFERMFWYASDYFRNRDGVIQRGVGRGLKFNTGPSNAGYMVGSSEPEVQKALAALIRPGMTVYDIGGNIGYF